MAWCLVKHRDNFIFTSEGRTWIDDVRLEIFTAVKNLVVFWVMTG
jgi:hypothetical protein